VLTPAAYVVRAHGRAKNFCSFVDAIYVRFNVDGKQVVVMSNTEALS
jgi:hypothetical protein